jgi:2-dehydropantoate 2-reductase
MKIAVVGTGGVGGYFGGKLASGGNDVTFVARGEHYNAIKNKGLFVKSIDGDFRVSNVKVVKSIQELNEPELIILGVKAWQVKEIAPELKNVITKDSVIIPLQNGVAANDELKEYIDGKNILVGLCRIMSKIESPGVINHFGIEPFIMFGEIDNSKTERVLIIKKVLDNSGIKSRIPVDVNAELWKKYISICVSGLLAVTHSTYGPVRELKETRQMMIDLMNEIYAVSQKTGINIDSDFVGKTLAFIDTFPYDSTSSLTRDVWEGNPSEIEYQNGYVSRLGAKLGIPTPVNTFIYNCILPLELKARKEKRK